MKAGLNTGTEATGQNPRAPGFEPPAIAELAALFPQLEIVEFIGKGGMGAVYKARQPALDRLVALKILPPDAGGGETGFPERFTREARALAKLSHPNIVAVYDFGVAGSLHYLLMEYVDGGNLRQVERAGKLTPEQALAIVPQICEALQFAHNAGVVHRDIKPENILLDKTGRVKITDFGIAKILGITGDKAPLTGARDVVGTPHYMAPEQIETPRAVDHRADIYSLGVVFYEMLTGELPLGKFAPPSRKVQVDVRLDEVVLHALEKEPRLRYQNASQVKSDVETITHSGPLPGQTSPAGSAGTAEELRERMLASDYQLNIRNCLRRGWNLVTADFWPSVGVTALVYVLLGACGSFGQASRSVGNVHVDTSILSFILGGPLMGGLYLYFLAKIRGQRAKVDLAFSGFSKLFVQLMLAGLVTALLSGLGLLCFILPGIFLAVAWKFSVPLVADKGFEFWPAMRLSMTAISKHWWKFFGFVIVSALVNLAGLLCGCVGVFVTLPVTIAASMYAYEDIFNGLNRPAPQPASSAAPRRGIVPVLLALLVAGFLVLALAAGLFAFGFVRHTRAVKTANARTGAGLLVNRNEQTHQYVVTRTFLDSPAANAGIEPGQILYKINGTLAEEKNFAELSALLNNPQGRTLDLEFMDPHTEATHHLEIKGPGLGVRLE
jgi:predicted Ser/Thr protein kinase